jgi:hypothetical protein
VRDCAIAFVTAHRRAAEARFVMVCFVVCTPRPAPLTTASGSACGAAMAAAANKMRAFSRASLQSAGGMHLRAAGVDKIATPVVFLLLRASPAAHARMRVALASQADVATLRERLNCAVADTLQARRGMAELARFQTAGFAPAHR